MDFAALISKMISFIALMLVGYVCVKKNILDKNFSKGLSFLVMNVFLPCTILNSVIANHPDISGAQLMHAIAMLSLAMLLPYIFAAAAARLFCRGGKNAAVFELLCSVINTMFIGLPILESMFGSIAVLYCALSCLSYNLLLYTYGTWRLRASLDGADHALHLKSVFTAPFVATLIALIIFVFDVPAPRLVREIVSSVSVATGPSSMIVVGATLGNARLLDALKEKSVYLISLVRLVLIPAIVLFVLRFLTDDPVLLANCVILAACPSAVLVAILSLQYGTDAVYASKGILVTTALSMITLPVWAYILG